MATKIPLRNTIDAMEPRLRAAFLASIADLKTTAQLAEVTRLIQSGSVDEVIRALNLAPEFFGPLSDAIRASYTIGGSQTLTSLPKPPSSFGPLVIRFGGTNPRAEAWLRDHSSRLITSILNDQRAAIRVVLEAGVAAGQNPRTIALNIVGRVNRATGLRQGGIVGLTEQQATYVANAQVELLSGNPTAMRSYLNRIRRDRRFDSIVNRAIANGKAVSQSDVNVITGRYADRLLKLRGDTIARTEALASLHAGQQEGLRQLVDSGKVKQSQVQRIWRSAADGLVRDSHVNVNGESVGVDERFSNGLMYPGDSSGGAAEVINCRCDVEVRIDYLGDL